MDVKELIGVTLGTCTLERVVGRGGMGAVFMAQQARPVRTVAVKVLVPPVGSEDDQEGVFLARFRREADTVARLEHKNILPIYEYDEAVYDQQKLAYLVMPFVRGGTLRERIDEMKRSGSYFDLNLVASYISQVADALSYAHSLGVVHRDVKPGNLLFHQDGRLLLSDFGIVRLKALPSLTSVGSFLGTAEYASPEQISTSEIDFRSDIYSLGTILYELLTNTVPYNAPSPFVVMSKKLSDPVPSIRSMRPDLSEGIEEVVVKALARNPADRYQTATMLAADLRAAVASSVGGALHIRGDASYNDLTIAERPWGALAPLEASVAASNVTGADSAFPPTQHANPMSSNDGGEGAPWQQGPRQWQWPSQAQAQLQTPDQAEAYSAEAGGTSSQNNNDSSAQPASRDITTYTEGRRLFYYGTALITLLLQFLVLLLLFAKTGATSAMLGILVGGGINLLILAAIGFVGVTRNRNIRKFLVRALINALLVPLVSGLVMGFVLPTGKAYPLIAYILLLLSNIYALRQLALVDAAKEQVEVASVRWRPALMGAVTGLLPLTIILIFALEAPFEHLHHVAPLLNLFGMVFVVFIGTPTPGSVMAVRLLDNMRFPSLLRSSALAGMLMFVGASLLVVTWSLLFPNKTQFLYDLKETWLGLLIILSVLSIVGALRGMLDAWLYRKIRMRNRSRGLV
ncbi:MAG: hypothetical protein NVSMB33_07690 [Ktedonobacteraceae bacterium]